MSCCHGGFFSVNILACGHMDQPVRCKYVAWSRYVCVIVNHQPSFSDITTLSECHFR